MGVAVAEGGLRGLGAQKRGAVAELVGADVGRLDESWTVARVVASWC